MEIGIFISRINYEKLTDALTIYHEVKLLSQWDFDKYIPPNYRQCFSRISDVLESH